MASTCNSFGPFVDFLGQRRARPLALIFKDVWTALPVHRCPRCHRSPADRRRSPPESVAPGRRNAPARRLSAPGTLTLLPSRLTCPRAAACRRLAPHDCRSLHPCSATSRPEEDGRKGKETTAASTVWDGLGKLAEANLRFRKQTLNVTDTGCRACFLWFRCNSCQSREGAVADQRGLPSQAL